MNDLRKAAEMALEALQDTCDHLPAKSGVEREVDEAITALQVALAQPEQELVIDCPRCGHCCPEREWVGLTKEEMLELFEKYSDRPFSLMLATHDKVKEKNT